MPQRHILYKSITCLSFIWARKTERPTVTPSAAAHGSGQQALLLAVIQALH